MLIRETALTRFRLSRAWAAPPSPSGPQCRAGRQDVLLALTNYSAELGQREQALGYASQLLQLAPGHRGYQQLYQQLGGK